MTVLLALIGGLRVATGYVGAVAFASMVLAIRGRMGAAPFFPLRACLFAPLWVLERSLSVYWALLRGSELQFSVSAPPVETTHGAPPRFRDQA